MTNVSTPSDLGAVSRKAMIGWIAFAKPEHVRQSFSSGLKSHVQAVSQSTEEFFRTLSRSIAKDCRPYIPTLLADPHMRKAIRHYRMDQARLALLYMMCTYQVGLEYFEPMGTDEFPAEVQNAYSLKCMKIIAVAQLPAHFLPMMAKKSSRVIHHEHTSGTLEPEIIQLIETALKSNLDLSGFLKRAPTFPAALKLADFSELESYDLFTTLVAHRIYEAGK